MPKPIRLFVYADGDTDETYCYTLEYYRQMDAAATEESVAAAHEAENQPGRWVGVEVKPYTAALDRDIKRAARVPDGALGFTLDETELPASRASIAVESWGFDAPVSKEGFLSLPGRVAAVLDAVLCHRLYGGGEDIPFLRRLAANATSSEAKMAERQGRV